MMLVVKLLASKILDLESKCVECGVNHNIYVYIIPKDLLLSNRVAGHQ
jgi:hypothetical protein